MTIKVGINGFGRMGRLTLRALWDLPGVTVDRINEPEGSMESLAHLLEFDSVHGRWPKTIHHQGDSLVIDGQMVGIQQEKAIEKTHWSGCDLVLEASGKHRTKAALAPYFTQSVKKVVVSAPVKEPGVLNAVMGINHQLYAPGDHAIVTAASCTTNCLAPVVKVINEHFGIRHGSMTTIHDVTNTQTILDAPHKDLRRARACGMSLIPTTTGSATAITEIFPELKGRLNGHAIRVPLANASLTDCVFELEKKTDAAQVNHYLKQAAEGELAGILGYEEKPLVSIDYRSDPRSCVIDALSTLVVNDTQLKLYCWYDNEWGYANRTAELIHYVVTQSG